MDTLYLDLEIHIYPAVMGTWCMWQYYVECKSSCIFAHAFREMIKSTDADGKPILIQVLEFTCGRVHLVEKSIVKCLASVRGCWTDIMI
jgi:hypothetical protein